jgi:hypothetical protein
MISPGSGIRHAVRVFGTAAARAIVGRTTMGSSTGTLALLSVVSLVSACGGSAPETPGELPPLAAVLFTYRSVVPPPPTPPPDPGAVVGCVHHFSAVGGFYVLEGSWTSEHFRNPAGDCHDGCTLVVSDVPTDSEHVVRMIDLGLCEVDPTQDPFASHVLLANGVELTRIVDHPSGMRGAAFTVERDGTVRP